MTLTKETVINQVNANLGLSKPEARRAVETLLRIIKETLAREEDVLVSGFGKFVVRRKNSRRGRNPQTKTELILRARKVVVFKSSGVLRRQINQSRL